MTKRKQQQAPCNYGRNERTRVLVHEFGPKPNWMKWRTYHYLARHNPDKLRATLAKYSNRPAVLD